MGKFYEKYVEFTHLGKLPDNGLCNSIGKELQSKDGWIIIKPSEREKDQLSKENKSSIYWGSGLRIYDEGEKHFFTELRQTILLLAACLNNEKF